MPEPTTPNTGLFVPNTGDQIGTWGSLSLNPDFVAIDGMLGGTQSIALAGPATTILTLPPVSLAPTNGPNQSQNACLVFTGTLSGNNIVQLGMPGRYILHNLCLPFTFYVQVRSVGGGRFVGLPPGKKTTIYHDGTNVDFVDTPDVGTAYDLHGATGLPAWMLACSTLPYLIKDGTVYNIATYPFLGNWLGSTFGGNGITTFAVPNELARMRIAYDTTGTGLMTSPVNAQVMGSNGGEQAHTLVSAEVAVHTHPVTDPGHFHNINGTRPTNVGQPIGQSPSSGGNPQCGGLAISIDSNTTGITVGAGPSGGGGAHNNVQPSIVSFLALIKTAILVGILASGVLNMFLGYVV